MNVRRTVRYVALASFLILLLGSMASAQTSANNWAERFPSKMDPHLESALAGLPPAGMLDVYVVMKDRVSEQELLNASKEAAPAERSQIVADRLMSYAEASQQGVRPLLSGAPYKVLWISNALRFTGTKELIEAIRDLPEVGYLGLVRKFSAESYQDVPVRTPIYHEDFESGVFGPEWATATSGRGRIQLTGDNGPIGNYHVTMDSEVDGTESTCTMTLTVDLSAVTNCYLDFMFKEWDDESDPEDHVSISDDGVTFYTVLNLGGGSAYEQKFMDIDAAAATHGLTLNSDFRIRFSWGDNYSIPTDGFAFDEIMVQEGDVPPSPPTLNVINLQAPQCWDVGVTGDGALILNIDSGVDYTHSDLVNQIWNNPGEAPFGNNNIDDDNNGYIDDIYGWDFEDNDEDPYPSSYHGTATAGIVCGDGTGGTQTGMAPDATMAIAKIGDAPDYWEAQQYAILIGATVITSSYSYKWGIHDPDYHMFRSNCVAELAAGIIHANSLGNQGDQTSSYPIPFNISTPGNCPGPWIHPDQVSGGISSVMGCAGVHLDESLYTPSGQGPSAWEDILIYDPSYAHTQNPDYWDYPYGGFGGGQPGLLKPDMCTYTEVMTTDLGGGYRSSFGGTSAATPHLGGALCLLVSGNPHASPRKISQALQETAEDKGPAGKDLRYGAGKVQVYDALLRLMHNMEATNPDPSLGDSLEIQVSGVPGDYYALFFSGAMGTTPIPPIGTLDLASPFFVLLISPIPAGGMEAFPFTIGTDPGIVGAVAYFQSVMKDLNGPTGQYLFSLVERIEVH